MRECIEELILINKSAKSVNKVAISTKSTAGNDTRQQKVEITLEFCTAFLQFCSKELYNLTFSC